MQQVAAIRGATVEAFGLALPEEMPDGTVVSEFMDAAAYLGVERHQRFAGAIISGKKMPLAKSYTSNDRHLTGLIVEAARAWSCELAGNLLKDKNSKLQSKNPWG